MITDRHSETHRIGKRILEKIVAKSAIKSLLTVLMVLGILGLIGCGGVERVHTDLLIPDLDRTQFNDSQYEAGWKKLKAGKPEEALSYFQKSSAKDERLFVGYGFVYLAQQKYAIAQKNFEKALGLNPENLYAQLGLAAMHETMNDLEKAYLIYSRLRATYPQHAWIRVRYDFIKSTQTQHYLKQAELYRSKNETSAYIDALTQAVQYAPDNVEIKMQLADVLYSKQQFLPAAKYYEMVLEQTPGNIALLTRLGEVYEKLAKYDDAALIYTKIQQFKPDDVTLANKIKELKLKFYDSNLPVKFKNIFFKENINREELAALIGYYFNSYLESRSPVIITDIGGSFAKEYILKLCTLEILSLRPDHSFDRFPRIDRAQFAVAINALIKYLEKSKAGLYMLNFTPQEEVVEPRDVSSLHKHYQIIKFLVYSGIMKLDEKKNFNPTQLISPANVLDTIKKILNSIHEH